MNRNSATLQEPPGGFRFRLHIYFEVIALLILELRYLHRKFLQGQIKGRDTVFDSNFHGSVDSSRYERLEYLEEYAVEEHRNVRRRKALLNTCLLFADEKKQSISP